MIDEVLSSANILWSYQTRIKLPDHSRLDVQPVIPQSLMEMASEGKWEFPGGEREPSWAVNPESSITRLFQIISWWEASSTQIFPPCYPIILITASLLTQWQIPFQSRGSLFLRDYEIFWKAEENYILSSLRNLLAKHPHNLAHLLFL